MARLVYADDSPTLRTLVGRLLSEAGHEVTLADDGVAAVRATVALQPDAVILDVQMPRLGGIAAARMLKDDYRTGHIPLMLLTSLDAAADRFRGEQAAVDAYLTKEFRPGQLADAVAELLASSDVTAGVDGESISDDEVLSAVADMLDRQLFDAAVAQAIAACAAAPTVSTVAQALLDVVARTVGFTAGILSLPEAALTVVDCRGPVADGELDAALALSGADPTWEVIGRLPEHADPARRRGGQVLQALAVGGQVLGSLVLVAPERGFADIALDTLAAAVPLASVVVSAALGRVTSGELSGQRAPRH